MDRDDKSIGNDGTPSAHHTEEHLRREAQARLGLEFALQYTDSASGSGPVLGALAELVHDAQDLEAYEMIFNGVAALVVRDPGARRTAHAWCAQRRGCDPTRYAVSILEVAEAVERTAYRYGRVDPCLGTESRAATVKDLANWLEARFSGTSASRRTAMPSLLLLEEWISKHDVNPRSQRSCRLS